MATLYITEYIDIAKGVGTWSQAQAPQATGLQPSLDQAPVAITASSSQSAAFQQSTILVRIHCDAICSVVIGLPNPTATTANARLAANQTEYFGVRGGDKLAVIVNV